MSDIRKLLSIRIESPYWESAIRLAENEPDIPEWLTENYIRQIHEKHSFFNSNLDIIVSAIPHIIKVPELCLLAKTLYHILDTKKNFNDAFTVFEAPKAPEGTENTIGYDCVLGFPVLAHLVKSWNELEKRGVEKDILRDSFVTVDHLFTYSQEEAGRPAFTEQFFRMYGNAIYINYLKIGRLRFEIYENSARPVRIFKNQSGEYKVLMCNCVLHQSGNILGAYGCEDAENSYDAGFIETDTYYCGYSLDEKTRLAKKECITLTKSEWKCVYKSGDNALKVHIPYGPRLDKESCEESYRRAKEVFSRCFPEIKFNCFLLLCWMLSPELRDILPEDSNIIGFQNKYIVFPAKDKAIDAYQYVYKVPQDKFSEIDIFSLPEDNTIRRGIKKKALEGKLIRECYGFFEW